MKVIQPNCRIQFTGEDIDFILTVLGNKTGPEECLIKLLTDPETRDLILDDEKLFHALIEQRGCLRVSNHFYFYILVRNVLRKAQIEDRRVADYVAEMLAEFSRTEQMQCCPHGPANPLNYFFEMLAALQTSDARTSFYIRTHIGNHTLFLSGVFPERIRHREGRGFPGMKYYEQLGRTNFRVARDHQLAQRYDLAKIFDTLSERFQPAREALNDLSERIFTLTDNNDSAIRSLLHKAGME